MACLKQKNDGGFETKLGSQQQGLEDEHLRKGQKINRICVYEMIRMHGIVTERNFIAIKFECVTPLRKRDVEQTRNSWSSLLVFLT